MFAYIVTVKYGLFSGRYLVETGDPQRALMIALRKYRKDANDPVDCPDFTLTTIEVRNWDFR